MCGRFANDAKVDEMIQEFVAEGGDYRDWRPQFSIAPTQVVPIVRERQNKDTGEVTRSVDAAVWNFHPSFMKESKRPQFNTRIETVATNGLWKGAFASSRCLVRGSDRADVNGVVRRHLGARKLSFAPMDDAVALTGMEYGGITPIGLPADWPILVDESVAGHERLIVGSGIRGSKILVSGAFLASLPNAEVLPLAIAPAG